MTTGRKGLFSWQTLRLLALLFLALRFVTMTVTNPFMDEAYYWMWGQHPALSYIDHPPLVAWVNAASAAIFGWSKLALRLPVLLTMLADLWILFLFARRLGGAQWREIFWLSALLSAATPAFILLGYMALPDHLLIPALLAALYCFHGVLLAHEAGRQARRLLYLGAIALGLALLSKFTAALFGLGLLLYLVFSPRHRGLLRDVHVWLAIGLVAFMQTPVIIWNLQHELVGFGYVMGGRSGFARPNARGLLGYLLGVLLMLSPFLIVATTRFLATRGIAGEGIARTIAWTSFGAFLAASLFTNILIHWNAIMYIAALPFIGAYLRSRLALVGHLTFGLALLLLVNVNYGIFPVLSQMEGVSDPTSGWSHGWVEVAARVTAAAADHPGAFIAGTSYENASQLAFALGNPDVTSLAGRHDAYDDFFDAAGHAGHDALVISDEARHINGVRDRFATLTLLETIPIERLGRVVAHRELYLGTGFIP
ncbi:MAG: glycosyltransferase family 39 protein [Devosia sp.]